MKATYNKSKIMRNAWYLKRAAALGVSVPELFAPQPTNTITCPKCGTVLEVKERE